MIGAANAVAGIVGVMTAIWRSFPQGGWFGFVGVIWIWRCYPEGWFLPISQCSQLFQDFTTVTGWRRSPGFRRRLVYLAAAQFYIIMMSCEWVLLRGIHMVLCVFLPLSSSLSNWCSWELILSWFAKMNQSFNSPLNYLSVLVSNPSSLLWQVLWKDRMRQTYDFLKETEASTANHLS